MALERHADRASRRSECTSFTRGARPRSGRSSLDGRGCRPTAARARRSAARDLDQRPAAASGDFTSTENSKAVPQLLVDVGQAGNVELGELGRGRRRDIRGAGRPRRDDAVVGAARPHRRRRARRRSRARAPASRARRNAGIVFSGSSSRAPRWANVMAIRPLRGHRATLGRRSSGVRSPDIVACHRPTCPNPQAGPEGLPKGSHSRQEAGAWFTRPTKDGDEAVTTIRANCPSCGDVQLTARRPDRARLRGRRARLLLLPLPRVPRRGRQGREPAHRRPPRLERRAHAGVAAAGRAHRGPRRAAAHARRPPRLPSAARGGDWYEQLAAEVRRSLNR